MTQTQVKEQLNALVDLLPAEQAALLLDFAVLLRQRQTQTASATRADSTTSLTEWEAALATAEEYWFQLPESVRARYSNQTVAILREQILDADQQLKILRQRVASKYPNQPVLYLDADAELMPLLFVRSPRLR
jgi:hypothetical protein